MTTRPWDADVAVDPELVGQLIGSQFPEFRPVRATPLQVGWDNAAFVVNDTWIFRFPRRKLGAEILEIELRWLPTLTRDLPIRVSAPERIGRPEGDYPYPFAGYPRIEGRTACSVVLDDPMRARLAHEVGTLLRSIHSIPLPPNAPADTIRRADLARRLVRLQEPLARIASRLGLDREAALRRDLSDLARTPPWSRTARWVHGDLYARHLVLDEAGALAGVIDWGDLHAGDPALDLSIAFTMFDPPSRDTLFRAYGEVDRDTLDRARFRALHYGVILTDYGLEVGDAPLVRVGEEALRRALP